MTDAPKRSRGRWIGIGAILFAGWLLLVLGVMGIYMYRSLYNENAFSKRVTAVLEEPQVQTAVAMKLTDEIVTAVPRAVVARPVIQSAAETVVATPAFTNILRTALVKFHELLLDPKTANLVFTVEGAPQLIEKTLAPYDEQIAAEVGNAAAAKLAEIPDPGPAFRLIQLGASLGPIAWIVALLGIGLMAVAALIAPVRRRGVITALIVFAFGGLGVVFILGLVRVGLTTVTANDPVLSLAAGGLFDGLFGTLRTFGWIIAAIGVVAAVIVWSLRFTLPVASSAAGRAAGGLQAAGSSAAGAVGAGAGAAAGALSSGTGTAVAAAGDNQVEAQDLMVAMRSGVRRAFTPAVTSVGRVVQGVAAILVAIAVLFAWSTVVDVLIIALALGLLALGLNRLLLVVFSHRVQRETVEAGTPPAALGTPDN